MSEDRSVHTDALKTLGTILGPDEARDAIHLAVEPVIAAETLKPGQDIGLLPDGRASQSATPKLGVVDPFLKAPAKPGERFWLIVYPRTITSLRHVWEHPNFTPAVTNSASKSYSEQWMRKWAMANVSDDYYGTDSEDAAYAFAIRAGHDHSVGGFESARENIDTEWWGHWEAITGCIGDRGEYFSCAC